MGANKIDFLYRLKNTALLASHNFWPHAPLSSCSLIQKIYFALLLFLF